MSAAQALDVSSVVFITPGGDRINGTQTPADVRNLLLCSLQLAWAKPLSLKRYKEPCMECFVQHVLWLAQFDLEDGDTIEVQTHQIGGR